MIIKTEELDQKAIYKLLIGSVVPRPIAWVSTVSKDGIYNIAPFSYFTVASSFPPVLCFSPALKSATVDGEIKTVPKDTLRNVRETGEFVVNIVSRNLAEIMNQTSADCPPEVSEFDKTKLQSSKSSLVKAPRVMDALISMECTLNQIVELGTTAGAGNLVLGNVVCFHFDDSVYNDGHIDIEALQPVARLAGNAYTELGKIFELPRPTSC